MTKSLRSEYDHLMLQLHDGMKSDLDYQEKCEQQTVPFPAGSVWVCFSDQTSHAVMSAVKGCVLPPRSSWARDVHRP